MNNKENHITNWIEQAEDDWRAVNTLFHWKADILKILLK